MGLLALPIMHTPLQPRSVELLHEGWWQIDSDHDPFFSPRWHRGRPDLRGGELCQEHVRALSADLRPFSRHKLATPVLTSGRRVPPRSPSRVGKRVTPRTR